MLVGEPSAQQNAVHQLMSRFEELGLQVNLLKRKTRSPQGVVSGCAIPAVDWSTPKPVLGTPFGSAAAIAQFLSETRAKHHALLQRLALLPDPQGAIAILRYCLGAQKINHLLRVQHNPHQQMFR